MTQRRTGAAHLKLTERRRRVFEMKKGGANFQQIADMIQGEFDMPKYTRADAYNDLKRMLDEFVRQPLDEYRDMEIEVLNTAQVAIWNRVLRGDLDATDMLLKIVDKRAKFQGTYAPTKIAGPDGGPLQIEVIAKAAVSAVVRVVDQLGLPPAKRAEVLDQLGADFLAIEESVTDNERETS